VLKQKVYRRAANGEEIEVWEGPTKYEPSPCQRCITEGRCYVDGRIVTKESNKSLDGCGHPEKRLFVVRTASGMTLHAPEAALDHMFPDEKAFALQKAKALEYATLQAEPAADRSIARAPGSSSSAVRTLITEGALVKCGLNRYYVPLKVQVGDKTLHVEPRSVKRWKAKPKNRESWAGLHGPLKSDSNA
jgi:hypothetical protein